MAIRGPFHCSLWPKDCWKTKDYDVKHFKVHHFCPCSSVKGTIPGSDRYYLEISLRYGAFMGQTGCPKMSASSNQRYGTSQKSTSPLQYKYQHTQYRELTSTELRRPQQHRRLQINRKL